MKMYCILVDCKVWDGDPEYDQLVGLIESNPEGVAELKIAGVTVYDYKRFETEFNKGKITSRKYELFMMECD